MSRTKFFSPVQKLRILANYDARVLVGTDLVRLTGVDFPNRNAAARLRHLNRIGCACQCACGCGAWVPLRDIRFDHWRAVIFGGSNHALSNGRPLAVRCHALKSASEHRANAKVKRLVRKLSVTITRDDSNSPESRTRKWSWPQRSFPKSSRPMQSRGFQKRWEPRT